MIWGRLLGPLLKTWWPLIENVIKPKRVLIPLRLTAAASAAETSCNVPKYEVSSGPYLLIFGLNTEIYSVNLRIQPVYGKIRTRKNSAFGHFSHGEMQLFIRKCLDQVLQHW